MLLLVPPALVQGPPQGPPPQGPSQGQPPRHRPDVPVMRLARELGLRDDQLMKLHHVMDAHRDAVESKELALHQAHRAVHEAVREPGTSPSQVESLARAASEREIALLMEIRALNSATWEILDANQQAKAKVLMARPPMEGPGGEGGPGRGHGRPGGPGGDRGAGGDRGPGGRSFGGPGEGGMPPPPPPEGPED